LGGIFLVTTRAVNAYNRAYKRFRPLFNRFKRTRGDEIYKFPFPLAHIAAKPNPLDVPLTGALLYALTPSFSRGGEQHG
jgi:hypothetical protein